MKITKEQSLFAFLIAQALILLCFYFPWLSNSSSYFFRDLTHYIEPFGRFTGDTMRHFEIPMWNPWTYCGMPQIAISVQGVCYPPTSLFAFMPFSSGLATSMMLHQLICGAGGFLLVMGLGWGVLPAIICGTTLAMSGYEFASAQFSAWWKAQHGAPCQSGQYRSWARLLKIRQARRKIKFPFLKNM